MALHGIVHTAQQTLERHLAPGDIAVDATMGAGFDSLFLAKCVGPSGRVYGFDIQDEAIEKATATLNRERMLDRVTLFKAGHERMREYLPEDIAGKIKAFSFNLGYLPGSDLTVTTLAETSLAAIKASMELIHPKGVISIAIYTGHPQGAVEGDVILDWACRIPFNDYRIARYEFCNKSRNKETLLFIQKVAYQKP